jgi:hypothetical protein
MVQRLRVIRHDCQKSLGPGVEQIIQRRVFEVDDESYDKALPGCMKS